MDTSRELKSNNFTAENATISKTETYQMSKRASQIARESQAESRKQTNQRRSASQDLPQQAGCSAESHF